MDKATLHRIFEKEYNHQDWIDVLQSVFGARQLYAQPKPILLPNNERATEAFELGSFTTSDDRIIGLYRVNVKSEVWLERNKVSLRELLRNVYKYDVDGAIVVFVQDEKWRLSFISEIKVVNDRGDVIKQATEPKRYTYLLGKGEKVRTPSDRLSKLIGKTISLQDMLNSFSVEALNEEFYKIVQSFFYELVGGKIGKGKKVTEYGNGILKLPDTAGNVRQEFAVRLIGRTVFCWFLKMKMSSDFVALFPESLLSSKAVKHYKDYYHSILELLFFQTLNTPMDKRISSLPEGAEIIPFLNGGLFEPNKGDYYRSDSQGKNQNHFSINDEWFLKFFQELEKYNFTIDENSVSEIEISVDPEILGRIFENLLAEIDPDSGETARKVTGSFYTPREIVDNMVTETLVQYLHSQTKVQKEKLRPIFKMLETTDTKLTESEKNDILSSLDKVKILDPACGSGAFPMGVLQKIVQALQKLDPKAEWWIERQIDRISNAIVKKQLKDKLAVSGVEYARKIGVIQNSLYGVDIQPIASEISKLRCFLSLIVDENIDETAENRGILPLPNLEFKFVTADTLISLPETSGKVELNRRGKKSSAELETELNAIRQDYIQSSGEDKIILKQKFIDIQKLLFDQQGLFGELENNRYHKISNWNPFNNSKSEWFDPQWMFGVKKFDIVLGNPPYVDSEKMTRLDKAYRDIIRNEYKFAAGNWDLFLIFIERGIQFLGEGGSFSYIVPNKLIGAKYAVQSRLSLAKLKIVEIMDYSRINVFKTADVYPITITLSNDKATPDLKTSFIKMNENYQPQSKISIGLFDRMSDPFWDKYFLDPKALELIEFISHKTTIRDTGKFSIGASATVSEAYLLKDYIYDKEIEDSSFKIINTGTIDPIRTLWGIKSMKYLKDNYEFPRISHNNLKKISNVRFQQASSPKIIVAGMSLSFEAFLDTEGQFCAAKSTSVIMGNVYDLYVLLAFLNSSTVKFYIQNQYLSLKMAGGYLNINPDIIKNTPIAHYSDDEAKAIRKTILILICLLNLNSDVLVNAHVSNSHIVKLFEDVLDAMVMELYFKDEFHRAGIEFLTYVERDFESIEGKDEPGQIEIIHNAYQKLRHKENEVRNNLKLMDIKLADIVMPIKTAK